MSKIGLDMDPERSHSIEALNDELVLEDHRLHKAISLKRSVAKNLGLPSGVEIK